MSAERVGLEQRNVAREPCAWVVRGEPGGGESGGGISLVQYNLDNNVVTLGYGDRVIDAPTTVFEDKEMLDAYVELWHEDKGEGEWKESDKKTTRSYFWSSYVWRFCNHVNVEDLVVLPPKREKWIAIGKITGPAERDADRPPGAQLYRQVQWLDKNVPEFNVLEDLWRAATHRRTFSQVGGKDAILQVEFRKRLEHLAKNGYDPGSSESPGAGRSIWSGDEAGVQPNGAIEVAEGAKYQVWVNRYERDSGARRWRLEHDGYTCQVCDLKFEDRYGEFALGYMQVHHVVPLSQITDHDNYKVNPEKDLVAVCPNCHAMLHHHPDKPCSVETLKQEIGKAEG